MVAGMVEEGPWPSPWQAVCPLLFYSSPAVASIAPLVPLAPQLETTAFASDRAQLQSFAHAGQGSRGGSFGIALVSAAFARTHSS